VTRESAVTANLAASFITLSPSILSLLLYVPYSTLNSATLRCEDQSPYECSFLFPYTPTILHITPGRVPPSLLRLDDVPSGFPCCDPADHPPRWYQLPPPTAID
jgi:hypothetical protein